MRQILAYEEEFSETALAGIHFVKDHIPLALGILVTNGHCREAEANL
ncbi:MAG: hypothetical protein WAL56_00325 [Candidatus Sulfotelmatobacter sp.]